MESYGSRHYTNKVIELADECCLDWREIAISLMCYMSEDDVEDWARSEEYILDDDEDEDDEDDDYEYDDDEEELIDSMYHDCSEDELRGMGAFGNEDEEDI